MNTIKRFAWAALGLLVLETAHAASFDCAKATTIVEKIICGDAELSRLDEELGAAYKVALKDVKRAVPVKQSQKQWVKERNNCADASCVKRSYEGRLQALSSFSETDSNPNDNGYASPHSFGTYSEQSNNERPKLTEVDAGLFEAVEKGDKAAVVKWLAKGANINARQATEIKDMGGGRTIGGDEFFTPLHVAVGNGHKEIVELLISKGAKVDAKGVGGTTPLQDAASNGYIEIVKLLLAKGADINAKSDGGMTPLHAVAGQGWCANCAHGDGDVTPSNSVAGGDNYSVGKKEMAEFLISMGADVNARDAQGSTPLDAAAVNGNKEIVELLIAKGAQVDAKDKYGITPLIDVATNHILNGKKEMIELLISKGANINVKDDRGASPLHAVFHKEVAELLLEKGADINAKDKNGDTPLQWAVFENRKEIAELLLSRGADVNVKNKAGRTVLQRAIESGNGELVKLLKAHGAKE